MLVPKESTCRPKSGVMLISISISLMTAFTAVPAIATTGTLPCDGSLASQFH